MEELIAILSFLALLMLSLRYLNFQRRRFILLDRLKYLSCPQGEAHDTQRAERDQQDTPSARITRSIFKTRFFQWVVRISSHFPWKVEPEQLERANLSVSPEEFQACRTIFLIFLSLLILLISGPVFLLMSFPPLTLLSWYLPLIHLKRREAARQEAISSSLPEMIDLLALLLEAGQGLNLALPRTVSHIHGPLAEEFNRALSLIELGASRQEALGEVQRRNPSPELRRFCKVFLRAERFGSPLASTMESLAEELRYRRKNFLREKAHKAPVKILFPLVFLILPSFLLLTIGGLILGGSL